MGDTLDFGGFLVGVAVFISAAGSTSAAGVADEGVVSLFFAVLRVLVMV
jgi:hypothetical protein